MPFTNDEIKEWEDNEQWQRACANILGEINSNYPKSKRINFTKRTTWILPQIVCDVPELEPVHFIVMQINQER